MCLQLSCLEQKKYSRNCELSIIQWGEFSLPCLLLTVLPLFLWQFTTCALKTPPPLQVIDRKSILGGIQCQTGIYVQYSVGELLPAVVARWQQYEIRSNCWHGWVWNCSDSCCLNEIPETQGKVESRNCCQVSSKAAAGPATELQMRIRNSSEVISIFQEPSWDKQETHTGNIPSACASQNNSTPAKGVRLIYPSWGSLSFLSKRNFNSTAQQESIIFK